MFKIKFKLRRFLHTMALVTMTPAVAGAAYLGVQYAEGNFHEVEQGQLYRSGQLNAVQIHDYTKRYGIRTIVNLRGQNAKADWYRTELTVSETLGLTHIDFGMSATRETSIEKVDELEKSSVMRPSRSSSTATQGQTAAGWRPPCSCTAFVEWRSKKPKDRFRSTTVISVSHTSPRPIPSMRHGKSLKTFTVQGTARPACEGN